MGRIMGITASQTEECIQKFKLGSAKHNTDKFHNPYFEKSHSFNESIEENIKSQSSVN